jgi:hypothetical protein
LLFAVTRKIALIDFFINKNANYKCHVIFGNLWQLCMFSVNAFRGLKSGQRGWNFKRDAIAVSCFLSLYVENIIPRLHLSAFDKRISKIMEYLLLRRKEHQAAALLMDRQRCKAWQFGVFSKYRAYSQRAI